ncbi:MAG: hypothetical protein L6Q54_00520 [Leptospiraceae bacterium]|nr:hypothetical protein [Leptospiraceae bacterium]
MKIILIFLFLSTSIFSKDHPIHFEIRKIQGNEYRLSINTPKQYGIQRDVPNRILLSGEDGLSVQKADLNFRGGIHSEKKEYFNKVEDMKITLKGKGKLNINAKIFYCDFQKNICIPANIQKTEIIQ